MSETGLLVDVDPRVRHLVSATQNCALQHVLFDRDTTDSYRIRLEGLRSSGYQLSRAEIMPALPAGSRWLDAVGWESYVVYPTKLRDCATALVAVEYVVAHSTRGAHPVFAGAVVLLSDVPRVLRTIATELDPNGDVDVAATYGVVTSRSRSVEDHLPTSAWLLRAAASAFGQGRPLQLRTVVLTEDEVSGSLLANRILLCTVPVIRDRFSWRSKLLLQGRQMMRLPTGRKSSVTDQRNARERIFDALKQAKAGGITPVVIAVPADLEADLALVPQVQLGEPLYSDITKYGVREAIRRHGGKLFGYRVVWDAGMLEVRGDEMAS